MLSAILVVAVVILASMSALITFYKKNRVEIAVFPQAGLMDQSINIALSNLTPQERITIDAAMTDDANMVWRSHAVFTADDKGMIAVAKMKPNASSSNSSDYNTLDGMGIFWSMLPPAKHHHGFVSSQSSISVTLSFLRDDKLVDQKKLTRRFVGKDIERQPVRENGMVGTLFYPKGKTHLPGIILLPGEEGGIPEMEAGVLASHGFAVLALGYFGVPGLPPTLENIPLEYFQFAMLWLKAQKFVAESRVALMGHGRGAELALLYATLFPMEVKAIVAYQPSSVVHGGLPHPNQPAWTYQKAALPFVGGLTQQEPALTLEKDIADAIDKGQMTKPVHDAPIYLREWYALCEKKHSAEAVLASLPVEKLQCPLLLIAGEADQIWPSYSYAKAILQRLEQQHSTIERQLLHYPSAGHAFAIPHLPSVDVPMFDPFIHQWVGQGGTAEGNAVAARESWQAVLAFLKKL